MNHCPLEASPPAKPRHRGMAAAPHGGEKNFEARLRHGATQRGRRAESNLAARPATQQVTATGQSASAMRARDHPAKNHVAAGGVVELLRRRRCRQRAAAPRKMYPVNNGDRPPVAKSGSAPANLGDISVKAAARNQKYSPLHLGRRPYSNQRARGSGRSTNGAGSVGELYPALMTASNQHGST